MKPAPSLPDDPARAELLRALELLDSPPEEVFDRITRLAAAVLGMPIALLSLVDLDRQFFKSEQGLGVRETPREVSFCAHALEQRAPLVVPDTLRDRRFADNPLVVGAPHIRFYAGVPVYSAHGIALGTICVIDHQPHELEPAKLRALQDLAAIAQRELVHRESVRLSQAIHQHSEDAVRASELRLSATFEQAAVGMALFAPGGQWLRINRRLADLLRYSDAQLRAMRVSDLVHADDRAATRRAAVDLLHGRGAWCALEMRLLRSDGQPIWVNVTASLVASAAGQPSNVLTVVEDIQERKHMERALAALNDDLERRVAERTAELRRSNERLSEAILREQAAQREVRSRELELRAVLENAHDAYIAVDDNGVIVEWNRQAELTFGWARDEALGRFLVDTIIPPERRVAHTEDLARYRETGASEMINRRLELPAVHRDGRTVPVELRLTALPSLSGRRMLCAFVHDISERLALQQRLAQQSLEDELTGLPNRRALYDGLAAAIARCQRSGQAMAVLFMDLDGFKAVNDRAGHAAGDDLLRQLALRLKESLRQTDTVARLGGDEFVILLEQLQSPAQDCRQVAEKLIARVEQPFELHGLQARVSTSIGAVICQPGAPLDADTLLVRADAAMYEAKRNGKARMHLVMGDVSDARPSPPGPGGTVGSGEDTR